MRTSKRQLGGPVPLRRKATRSVGRRRRGVTSSPIPSTGAPAYRRGGKAIKKCCGGGRMRSRRKG